MDINQYIASGILEDYVLNKVSAQEMQEVECLSHIYPEIKSELTRLQEGLEKIAIAATVDPPVSLKEKVMEEIRKTPQEKVVGDNEETKVITLSQQNRKSNIRRMMVAASIAALIGLGTFTFFLMDELSTTKNKLVTNESSLNEVKNDLENKQESLVSLKEDLSIMEEELNFLEDPNTQKINLRGTDKYPGSLATVFWNTGSNQVKLNPKDLPGLTENESYQLWILVDGVPEDMGVLDPSDEMTDSGSLMNMKSTDMADAFAITVEPLGGSESPTLSNLCVIGNVPTI